MIQTQSRKASTESFFSNASAGSSQEWRNKEARDMFLLLLGEYENSKRLGLQKRYKELKRIISMFTADPVLEKLKWLSEDHDDEDDDDDNNDDNGSSSDDGSAEGDSSGNGDGSATTVLGQHVRRLVSKMKTLSTLNMPVLSSTLNVPSSPSTPSSEYSDISASSFCSNNSNSSNSTNNSNTTSNSSSSNSNGMRRTSTNLRISNSNFLTVGLSNNNSAPTTPVSTTYNKGLTHITSMPLLSRLYSDSMENSLCSSPSFENNPTTCCTSTSNSVFNRQRMFSNSASNGSLNEGDGFITFQTSYDASTRSSCSSPCPSSSNANNNNNTQNHQQRKTTEFDKCLIRKDNIPAFEIPQRRVSTTCNIRCDIIDPNTLVPSLYMNSGPNSPTTSKKKTSKVRTSASSPNFGRFFGLMDNDSDCGSKGGFASKIKQAFRRDSRNESTFDFGSFSDGSESGCSSSVNFDIQKGHELLLKVKEEYESLPNWNVVTRYTKMKKMLKSCNAVDLN